jgi:hypothetical protein
MCLLKNAKSCKPVDTILWKASVDLHAGIFFWALSFFLDCKLHLSPWVAGNLPPPLKSQMVRPLGTMLAVYRICMYDKMCHFAALTCTVDGHTLRWKIGNKKSAPFLNVLFIKKFTGHACPGRQRYFPVKLWNFTGQWPVTGTYFEAWCWS